MRVNDQQVTFNMLKAMKSPDKVKDCIFQSVVNFVVTERIDICWNKKEIRAATFEELEKEDTAATHITWLREKQLVRHNIHFESLDLSNREVKPTIPSIESPPILELKLLPLHSKYVYLGKNNILLIIIPSSLNAD